MTATDEILKTTNMVALLQAYALGYDCERNGANETNCHFSIFKNPEFTKAWELGKADACLPYSECAK